jgi:hypothetical protein
MPATVEIPFTKRLGFCIDAVVEALRQMGDESRAAEIEKRRQEIPETAELATRKGSAIPVHVIRVLLLTKLIEELCDEFRAEAEPHRRALADMLYAILFNHAPSD